MARLDFSAVNTVKRAIGTSATTLLQLVAPANQRVAVKQVSVGFDGITNTNIPVLVQLIRQTTAGTTSSPSATIKPKADDISTSVQSTVQDGFTAEPTYGDVLWSITVHPQTGCIFPLPIPGELIVKGGGRLGLVCTAPQAVNAIGTIEGEE